jgi:hypothetical protein
MVQSLFFPNTLVDGWGIFWWLVIPILIAAPLVYKKVESRIIILNVSLNFLFLLAVYLFVFKKEEMMTIASFPRYVMGFTPIAILGVAYFYKFTKEWALSGK